MAYERWLRYVVLAGCVFDALGWCALWMRDGQLWLLLPFALFVGLGLAVVLAPRGQGE